MRTGPTTGYMSPNYVPGHVPGGDRGATAGYVVDCTVPTVPPASPSLPVTGNADALWQLAAGAFAAGLLLVLVSHARRR